MFQKTFSWKQHELGVFSETRRSFYSETAYWIWYNQYFGDFKFCFRYRKKFGVQLIQIKYCSWNVEDGETRCSNFIWKLNRFKCHWAALRKFYC